MADEEVQQNQSSEPAAAAAEPAAEVVPPAGGEAPSSDAMAEAEALAASLNAGIAAGGAAGAEAAAPDAPGSPDEGPSIESLWPEPGLTAEAVLRRSLIRWRTCPMRFAAFSRFRCPSSSS